ncbi:MAG: hypothetical protein IT462_02275 [Planctomycetes bacterium]|nr:hypothetical protein [Planctomycetota bacterium]
MRALASILLLIAGALAGCAPDRIYARTAELDEAEERYDLLVADVPYGPAPEKPCDPMTALELSVFRELCRVMAVPTESSRVIMDRGACPRRVVLVLGPDDYALKEEIAIRLRPPQQVPAHDGPATLRWGNGQPAAEGLVLHGRRAGLWREWWPDGTPRAIGFFCNGHPVNVGVSWKLNGQLESVVAYKAGRPVGVVEWCYVRQPPREEAPRIDWVRVINTSSDRDRCPYLTIADGGGSAASAEQIVLGILQGLGQMFGEMRISLR